MNVGLKGKGWLALVPGLFLVLAACNSADFGSSSQPSKRNKSNLTGKGKADANDGDGEDGADDVGGRKDDGGEGKDSTDAKDSGDTDATDGKDSGGLDSNGDSDGKDDVGGDDSKADDGEDDLGSDDGEVTATNSAPLTITRNRKDQGFTMKIELLYKDKVKKTETRDPPAEGQSITVDAMCRKGSKKTTELRVTIMGKATWSTLGIVEGSSPNSSTCIYALRKSEKEIEVDVDPGGFGGKGSNCGYKEDDILTFSCPDSQKLVLK